MKTPSKTILTLLIIGLVSCGLFSQQAQAVPITGGISLAGVYATDTGNLNTAKAFTSFSAVVTSVSGSYTGVPFGTSVTMNPFTFNPFSSSVTPLWTFMFGAPAKTYSFDLTVLSSVLQPGDDTLTLKGTGTLHITNFTDTPGTWVFTANQKSDTFSFSSSNGTTGVPDSGSAVALLGIALAGIEGGRRALRARRA